MEITKKTLMHLSFRYLTTLPLIALVRIYQVTIGPFLTGHCRFQPTCSVYALEALKTHGPIRGSWLAVRRILRCHPFGGAGYDPVPESKCKSRDCSTHTS